MQYTVRNVPAALDRALRKRADAEKKSLNEVTLEALARGMNFSEKPVRQRDLSDLAGSWKEDPDFDRSVAEQDVVDAEIWK